MKEYNFIFRYCDIVPAFHYHENDIDHFRKESNAINSVLLIPQEMRVLWNVIAREDDEESDKCLITATVSGEHDEYGIKKKYREYLEVREITHYLDELKGPEED